MKRLIPTPEAVAQESRLLRCFTQARPLADIRGVRFPWAGVGWAVRTNRRRAVAEHRATARLGPKARCRRVPTRVAQGREPCRAPTADGDFTCLPNGWRSLGAR